MSDDLISRKSLIENLNKFAPEHYTALVNDLIMKEPTAFDMEKVIEELKEMATHSASCKNQCEFGSTEYFDYMGAEVAYKTTIEIVEKGGIG